MRNCIATVRSAIQTLDTGLVVGGSATLQVIFLEPAYISAPNRSWQQQAALEGIYTATLMCHTANDLRAADTVDISDHSMAGTYNVVGVQATDKNWTISLQKRVVNYAN